MEEEEEGRLGKQIIEDTVLKILKHADLETATELSVRTAAAERLGVHRFDLHQMRVIRAVLESFLLSTTTMELGDGTNDCNDKAQELETTQKEIVVQQEVKSPQGGDDMFEDSGGVICKLSDKTIVAVQDFKGQSLVSIRDYYKKDGKQFPSATGISLTAKQWSAFRNCVPAIEEAIVKMKSHIRLQAVDGKATELSSMVCSPRGPAACQKMQKESCIAKSGSIVYPPQSNRNETEVETIPSSPKHHVPTNCTQSQIDAASLAAFCSKQHIKPDSLISPHPRFLVPMEPARLNGRNYFSWKQQMEFILDQMKVFYVLTEPCPSRDPPLGSTPDQIVEARTAAQNWADDDYICRHNILNSLSDNLFDKYSNKIYSARELWEELSSFYEEDFGTKRSEINKYIQFQMADGVSVGRQVEELNRIATSLMASGIWIEEYFHASVIISKLPPSWKEFRRRLMREEFLPLHMLMHRIKVEEEVRNSATGKSSKFGNKLGPRRRETIRVCYICGKEGHISRFCPHRRFEICENGNAKGNDAVLLATGVNASEEPKNC